MANRPNSIFPSYGSKIDIEKKVWQANEEVIVETTEDEILEVEQLEEIILNVQTSFN